MIEASRYEEAYETSVEIFALHERGYRVGEWYTINVPGVLAAFERSCGQGGIERVILRWEGKITVFRMQTLSEQIGSRYAKQDYELGYVSYRSDGKPKDSITPRVLCPEQAESILINFIGIICKK